MLKNRLTYEIMSADSVGWDGVGLVLGKHSGRHALRARTAALGYELSEDELTQLFVRFKQLADRKKGLDEHDIRALMLAGADCPADPAAESGRMDGSRTECGGQRH